MGRGIVFFSFSTSSSILLHCHGLLDGFGQDVPMRHNHVDIAGETKILLQRRAFPPFSKPDAPQLPSHYISHRFSTQRQSPDCKPAVDKVVIVCPSSLVKNWANEFNKWLHGRVPTMPIDSGSREEITKKLQQFLTSVGRMATPVLIISYETLRGHADTMSKGKIGLVICDEVSSGEGGVREMSFVKITNRGANTIFFLYFVYPGPPTEELREPDL